MQRTTYRALAYLICLSPLLLASGCSSEFAAGVAHSDAHAAQYQIEPGKANISGKLFGADVNLDTARFNGQLSLSGGGAMATNSSIFVFLFLDDESVPAGKTFKVSESDRDAKTPHLHCRFPDTTGDTKLEMLTGGYNMTIRFGEIENGFLPGEFELEVPGKDASLRGQFRAEISTGLLAKLDGK